MRMRLRAALLCGLIVTAAGGCHVGPTGRGLQPARGPHGLTVVVPHVVRGELLEAREEGMVLLTSPTRVVLVPYASLNGPLRLAQGAVTVRPGSPPRDDDLRRLRALSRFPQGIPASYLERLLQQARQSDIEVRG